MLKIGDFSKLTHISIRMLRYYDENDVLKPVHIDEDNGYRYYSSEQLYWASQINFLKETGFSTAMIREILRHFHDAKELRHYFHAKLCELQEDKEKLEETIRRLQRAEELLEKEDMFMKYEVCVKNVEGMKAICKRDIIPTYEREDLLWKGLTNEIKERNLTLDYGKESPRAYFFDNGFKERDVDVEICIAVNTFLKDSDSVKFKMLEDQECACATFQGSYSNITDVCITIGKWISDNGYEIAGPNFCIYHVGYTQTNDEKEFVTEICYPIKKAN